MVKIYCIDVGCFSDGALYLSTLNNLTDGRRQKTESYKSDGDKYLSLGAGYLLKVAFKDAGLDYDDGEIALGKYGKPYLKSGKIHFNLSHSGKMAAVAISDCEVGVDIQAVAPVNDKLIRRVSTDREYAALSALSDEERQARFYRLWTAKESVMKYLGAGLSLSPASLEVDLDPPISVTRNGDNLGIFLREFENFDGYKLTVASQKNEFAPAPEIVTL